MDKTVLVVEDDFDTLYPLAELLRLKGYSVTTASDAERALTIARNRQPNLIITDIVLPGKSGLQFITSVRHDERIKATPIIVISGCGPMILVEAEGVGANFCLEKPINIERFWAAIEKALEPIQENDPSPHPGATDDRRALANEIDRLVEELRHCTGKGDREALLKQLKAHILQIQALNKTCA